MVSRQLLVDSSFSSVICAPIYSRRDGLHSQVEVGVEEGLKHECSVHCDELMSLLRASLTNYIGSVSPAKLARLDRALAFAVGLTGDPSGGGAS